MIKKITIFFVIFLFTISLSLFSTFLLPKVYYTGNEKVIVTGKLESMNSFISYVTINGKEYIIKQKRDTTKQIMAAIRDALAAYIAQDLNVAHSIQIISALDNIPGKANKGYPATLHTRAAGKMVSQLKGHKYFLLCLKQRRRNGEKITGRWLTETIVNQITWHKHLAIIVALDLFIGNTDRNRRNLFYDEETDSFCAIDMENIYKRDLSKFAYEKLNEMIKVHQKQFTSEEIKALMLVKSTLEFLLKNYPVKRIIAQFDRYAKQLGYVNNKSFFNMRITKKMTRIKRMIRENHASTHKLVRMLHDIINGSYG